MQFILTMLGSRKEPKPQLPVYAPSYDIRSIDNGDRDSPDSDGNGNGECKDLVDIKISPSPESSDKNIIYFLPPDLFDINYFHEMEDKDVKDINYMDDCLLFIFPLFK